MYREIFISYLRTFNYLGHLKAAVEYLLKNPNASYTRAQLTLAWCDECGGNIEDALPLAFAVECLHVSSLIQDDLPCMDNSDYRRKKLSTHLVFDESSALLASDILINCAYQAIIKSDLSNDNKQKSLLLLSHLFIDLCEGQYLDLHQQSYNTAEYMSMIKMKTSSLIQMACGFGAIAANQAENRLNESMIFGELIGIMYQINDDMNDNENTLPKEEKQNIHLYVQKMLSKEYNNEFLKLLKEKIIC